MMRLSGLQIDAPFYQAGLAGYSDAAMRIVAREHGCPHCVTEAMLDHFLITGGRGLKAAELRDDDHPITGQLMGSHPQDIAQGAKILVDLGYDAIDVNLACPVKKIKKKARGGHLLSDTDTAIDILKAVRQATPDTTPITVKLRRGSDDEPGSAERFYKIYEAAIENDYAGATVHGRTVEQKYLGPANWAFLADLTKRYPKPANRLGTFSLGGSGDIWNARDIFRMIEATAVDWVSVARGCIGNPWLFRQARALMNNDPEEANRPPTIHEQRAVLLRHFKLSLELHGEIPASKMMRKFGIKFSRHHPEADAIKQSFIAVSSLADWHAVLDRFYDTDGPGVVAEAENQIDNTTAEEACAPLS
ncbi:tRNA dihydrouridine synthase [Mucisphaera sp.]|uniref:tRNA dihydrouridine synthase n=1 Tax=Mucisphaera sp. TaxID=2913024 RepID=UPI003D0E340A